MLADDLTPWLYVKVIWENMEQYDTPQWRPYGLIFPNIVPLTQSLWVIKKDSMINNTEGQEKIK